MNIYYKGKTRTTGFGPSPKRIKGLQLKRSTVCATMPSTFVMFDGTFLFNEATLQWLSPIVARNTILCACHSCVCVIDRRPLACLQRVEVMTRAVKRVSIRTTGDNSIRYTMIGRSEIPPSLMMLCLFSFGEHTISDLNVGSCTEYSKKMKTMTYT